MILNYFSPLKFVYAFFVTSIWLVSVNVSDILERNVNNGAVWCVFCVPYISLTRGFFTVLFRLSMFLHVFYATSISCEEECSKVAHCDCGFVLFFGFFNSLTFGFTYFKDLSLATQNFKIILYTYPSILIIMKCSFLSVVRLLAIIPCFILV